MKRLRLLFIILVSTLALAGFAPAAVLADCSGADQGAAAAIQCGANGANSGAPTNPQDATTTANGLITSALNILTVVAGIIGVVMIILAGYYYMTSSGSQEKVATAKRTLMYAIIGLVIAALARIIARFVLNRVAGA